MKKNITTREQILALYFYYEKDWYKIYSHLYNKIKTTDKMLDTLKGKDLSKYITIVDAEYPKELTKTMNPPFVLTITQEGDEK